MANLKTVEIEDANGNKLKGFIDTNGVRISDFGKPPEETANIIDDIQNLPVKMMTFCSGQSLNQVRIF